jgi:hypothetical protein
VRLSVSGSWLVAVLLFAVPAKAQTPIPRTADGKPDLSGIWQSLNAAEFGLEARPGSKDAPPSLGIVDEGAIPYQPWALEKRKQNVASRETLDPQTKCFSLGTPRAIYYPEPFQIFQRPRDLTLLFEFGHSVRTIHTNGSTHPEGPLDLWLGDSRAEWDGDTLIVDVTEFNDQTWFDRAGNFHSDGLHVVERWRMLDANTIEYGARIEDAKVFTRPWNLAVILHRRREPGVRLIENYCYTREYDQFYPYPGVDSDQEPPARTQDAKEGMR